MQTNLATLRQDKTKDKRQQSQKITNEINVEGCNKKKNEVQERKVQ